jgi:hypothetical protein
VCKIFVIFPRAKEKMSRQTPHACPNKGRANTQSVYPHPHQTPVMPSVFMPAPAPVPAPVPVKASTATKSSCDRDEKPEECCCNVLNKAYGDSIADSVKYVQEVVRAATAAALASPDPATALGLVYAKFPVVQELNLKSAALIGKAFTDPQFTSPECCVGYAYAVKTGLGGIYNNTVGNIFFPLVTVEQATDNIAIALRAMNELVVNAATIASGDCC